MVKLGVVAVRAVVSAILNDGYLGGQRLDMAAVCAEKATLAPTLVRFAPEPVTPIPAVLLHQR
jgi:hypothetical protein